MNLSETVAGLRDWVGRTTTEQDELSLFPARGMAALLDREPKAFQNGSLLPPGWHWLYFKPTTPQSQLGDDGHARRGDFLPPVTLPRRMWAGGSLRFHTPLRLGEPAERISTIRHVEAKEGRSGRLVFVNVHHSVTGARGLACDEEQHIVYRDAPSAAVQEAHGQQLPEPVQWREEFLPSRVALFRFSALTFNGHRIHYDQPYAEHEGYPDLVVHAPLIALLLLDAAGRHAPEREPSLFEYRAVAPLFAGRVIRLQGGPAEADRMRLWATNDQGRIAMTATLTW
jgi:3-methylfumaryl-CoA hydratase